MICLDFDDVKPEPDEFTYAQWVSPSGTGVKRLVKIKDGTKHDAHVLALMEDYPEADKACKDVSRVCYESFDPDLYVNDRATVYGKQVQINEYTQKVVETDTEKIFEYIKTWLDKKGEYFYEGQRNNYLNKIAYACNCFGIAKDDARAMILYNFVNAASGFTVSEMDNVLNSAYKDVSVHGSAKFENEETTHEKQILNYGGYRKDVIYLRDIADEIKKLNAEGVVKGETTYFPEIDGHFRWMRGEL
ncbi:unnamed protein product, partial [marine sediment metagenome]